MDYPKISIVTPSYNQGKYLEETILSVIGQNYPNLEYIIIDGGSTDNSVEIIKKYEKYLTYWVSEKDNGQSEAINKGFSKATGYILGWLNSDDMYLPGALHFVASKLNIDESELIFGNCFHFVEGEHRAYGSNVKKEYKSGNLLLYDYIIQPSTFWTRKAWERVGPLDEIMRFAFDWDWFIRAKDRLVIFKPQDKYLSIYRIHKTNKTNTGGKQRLRELALLYRKYSGIKHEKLFLDCCAYRRRISFVKKFIKYFGLSRFEIYILKAIFIKLFFRFKKNELKSIMTMAGV